MINTFHVWSTVNVLFRLWLTIDHVWKLLIAMNRHWLCMIVYIFMSSWTLSWPLYQVHQVQRSQVYHRPQATGFFGLSGVSGTPGAKKSGISGPQHRDHHWCLMHSVTTRWTNQNTFQTPNVWNVAGIREILVRKVYQVYQWYYHVWCISGVPWCLIVTSP